MRPFFVHFSRETNKIGHTHIIQHPVKLIKAFQVVTGRQRITRNKARKSQFNEKEVNFCRFFLILKPVAPKRMVISFQEKTEFNHQRSLSTQKVALRCGFL